MILAFETNELEEVTCNKELFCQIVKKKMTAKYILFNWKKGTFFFL